MSKIKESSFYHRVYPLAQRLNIVGAWDLTKPKHLQAIEGSNQPSEPTVLYSGTATARNPQDAASALSETGYNPKMITIDLFPQPLRRIPRRLSPIRADATEFPFQNDSIDIVTTDFLFNMVDLNNLRAIGKEWARVLKPDGIATTTAYLTDAHIGVDTSYKRFLHGIGVKNFFTKEALEIALQCEGLQTTFNPFRFDKKPLIYPSLPYHLTINKMNSDESDNVIQNAQQIWSDAEVISAVTRSEETLAPRLMTEVITGIVNGNYIIDRDQNGIRGFFGVQPLIENWYEIGPLYVRPDLRGQGLGRELISQKLASLPNGNFIGFSDSPGSINILENEGFRHGKQKELPKEVKKKVIEDRLRISARVIATAKAALKGNKTLLIRNAG